MVDSHSSTTMALTLLPFPWMVMFLWHLFMPLNHPVDKTTTGVLLAGYLFPPSEGARPGYNCPCMLSDSR